MRALQLLATAMGMGIVSMVFSRAVDVARYWWALRHLEPLVPVGYPTPSASDCPRPHNCLCGYADDTCPHRESPVAKTPAPLPVDYQDVDPGAAERRHRSTWPQRHLESRRHLEAQGQAFSDAISAALGRGIGFAERPPPPDDHPGAWRWMRGWWERRP